MRKRLIFALVMTVTMLNLNGCSNRQIVDFTYSYDKAIISLPNGTYIEGKVSSWKDYEDGDQIQVKIDDKTYLVHSYNIVLISE